MKWRLFPYEALDGPRNFAIDEALANAGIPSIRLFGWERHAVSYGYDQDVSELDTAYAEKNGISLCRRPTVGKAVYHPEESSVAAGDISYSVIAGMEWFQKNYQTGESSYNTLCGWVASGIKKLGFDARVGKLGSILIDGKKVSGNTMNIYNGKAGQVILFEGSLWYRLDIDAWHKVMRGFDLRKAGEKMTDLYSRRKVDRTQVIEAISEAFKEAVGGKFQKGRLSDEERKLAEELLLNVYSTDAWNMHARRKELKLGFAEEYTTKQKGCCGTEW